MQTHYSVLWIHPFCLPTPSACTWREWYNTTFKRANINHFFNYRGSLAERANLQYFLPIGMILSGIFSLLFGVAHWAGIHSIYYFIAIQVMLTYEIILPEPFYSRLFALI